MNRFGKQNESITDFATGLMWTRDASPAEFPLTWQEGFDFVRDLNRSGFAGYSDWKIPNRKELFSLISHVIINPSLPENHPFINVFTGYYWTSTTCDRLPAQAWYIHLGGAKVYRGMKHGSYMIWPVREEKSRLLPTGQRFCYEDNGLPIECRNSGQDGELKSGFSFPEPRFKDRNDVVYDRATGLTWIKRAGGIKDKVDWNSAAKIVEQINREKKYGLSDWRLPDVVELESLTDMGRYSPALPLNHPFSDVHDFYWSSTTSSYNTDYAWVLYTQDGAMGVGYKLLSEFYVWPVSGRTIQPKLGEI